MALPNFEKTYNDINGFVESGSNTNGNWVKLIDGTMICYIKNKTLTPKQAMTEITLPNTYLSNNYVAMANSSFGSNADIIIAAFAYNTNTVRAYPRTNSGAIIAQEELCNIITIGRWK